MPKPIATDKFKVDVYGIKIYVEVHKDVKALTEQVRKLSKKFDIGGSDDYEYNGMVVTPQSDTYYLLLCVPQLTINTITHETDHLRKLILDFKGVRDLEASANLCGYINERVFRILKDHKLEIKY